MRSGTIAFIAGILFLQQLPTLPGIHPAIGMGTCILLFFSFRFRRFRLVSVAIIGFLWALLHAQNLLSHRLPAELEGKQVTVSGFIAAIPLQRERKWRFEFDVINLEYQGKPVPVIGRMMLSWYGGPDELSAGDKWRFTVRLKRPVGFMNPGGFDYEQKLFSQRIIATGYVRDKGESRRLDSDHNDYPLQRLRQMVLNKLQVLMADHPMHGIITALAIGHREAITTEQWRVLRDTGTSHLVAISGLHIGLVAGLVYLLSGWCWRRMGHLPLRIAAPRFAAGPAMMAALVYSALAGWSLPTQRAFIMVSVVMAAVFLQRTVVPSRTLALALLVVLVLDPFAVLSPGFWLSFGAVSVILFLVVGRPAPQSLWAKWGRTQWFVSLGLFPFLLAFFQQASLSAPLANLIAIPLVSLLVVPMVLTGLLLTPISGQLAAYLFRLAAELMAWLYSGLDWTAALPLSRFYAPVPDILTLLSAITGLLLLMMPRGWPVRWFGVILFSPLLLIRPAQPGQGEAWFSLLDVGQGLAAVVQTRRHVLVFDTGPWFSDRFDAGDAVVVPFLRQQGIGYIDTLVVSHGDIDHRGGVDSLRAQFPVSRLISSDTTLLHRLNGEPCRAGQQWEWDGVTFRVLSPAEDQGSQRENNQSCVLRIVSQNGSLLLPGDIEVEAEQALLGRYAESDLQADILVAPHHGSKTSSSDAFIRAVKPKFVLYPIGYRNRYHFPHSQVTSRLKAVSAQSFDSASHGAILFRTGPDGRWQEPITWRQENQRYWHVRIGHQTQN